MIDRNARDALAEATRHLATCQFTNYQFDDAAFDLWTADQAILDIRDQLWLLYDDLHQHKLDGKWALSEEQRLIVVRIVAFLKSDLEYMWPKRPLWYRLARPLIAMFTLGFGPRTIEGRFDKGLDLDVWPFSSKSEFDQAIKQPRYLAGAT